MVVDKMNTSEQARRHKIKDLLKQVEATLRSSKSKNTWRAYESSWDAFDQFCELMGLIALPAEKETVAMFMQQQYSLGLSASTLDQRIAAINAVHVSQQLDSPTKEDLVKEQMKGLKNELKGNKINKAAAATDDIIKRMLDQIDLDTAIGTRDRALLLYGYAGALRRSELVAINVGHMKEADKGHSLTIPNAKTDQTGKGAVIAILERPGSALCPIAAMNQWLEVSGIARGAVFRGFFNGGKLKKDRLSDKAVARLVKSLAIKAGLDPQAFSGHSLRSGYITSAVASGGRLDKVKSHARHKAADTTLAYVANRDSFEDHAGQNIKD